MAGRSGIQLGSKGFNLIQLSNTDAPVSTRHVLHSEGRGRNGTGRRADQDLQGCRFNTVPDLDPQFHAGNQVHADMYQLQCLHRSQ